MKQLSMKYFGTPDYNAALEALMPSDTAVIRFLQEARKEGFDIGR